MQQLNPRKAGRQIRRWRDEKNWTQTQAVQEAEKAGLIVNQTDIAKLELGKYRRPSLETVMMVGRLYGKTPQEMVDLFEVFQVPENSSKKP